MSPNNWAFTGLISSVIRSGSPPIQWCFHYPTPLSSFSSLFSSPLCPLAEAARARQHCETIKPREPSLSPNWKMSSSDHPTVKRRSPAARNELLSAAVDKSITTLVISTPKNVKNSEDLRSEGELSRSSPSVSLFSLIEQNTFANSQGEKIYLVPPSAFNILIHSWWRVYCIKLHSRLPLFIGHLGNKTLVWHRSQCTYIEEENKTYIWTGTIKLSNMLKGSYKNKQYCIYKEWWGLYLYVYT